MPDGCRALSVVTSGRALTEEEVERLCDGSGKSASEAPSSLRIAGLSPRASSSVKEAGLTRYHNNLEIRGAFSTGLHHTYDDKIG